MASGLIKELLTTQPRGAPFGVDSLKARQISSALAHEYVKSGWLERLGRGVFMFKGDKLQLDPTLQFLQTRIPGLHIASKSALGRHGFRQNLPHLETVILWGDAKRKLPTWFSDRFPSRYRAVQLFDGSLPEGFGLSTLPGSPNSPLVSTPERALLEMLSEVGLHQEIEEARGIMESVRRLRPKQLDTLLNHCRLTKVIRLCLVWGEELGLPWVEQARASVGDRLGNSRWVWKLKDGGTLILKP